jgi:hypothetical protein
MSQIKIRKDYQPDEEPTPSRFSRPSYQEPAERGAEPYYKESREEPEERYRGPERRPEPKKPRGRFMSWRFWLVTLVVVVALGASAVAYYYYRQATNLQKDPTAKSQQEAKDLVARVGKLIELPTDEEPTVATVSDPEKLKDQPFFAKAKAGDKVLIYAKAKKAILYDPVANKLIEVAPINTGNFSGANSAMPTSPTNP